MEMIPYIATRRARFIAMCGQVNIPWGTTVEEINGILTWAGLQMCLTTSQNAHDYFARNDDGNGLERGRLSAAVVAELSKRDRDHAARWDKVWADPLCRKYRDRNHADHWLWNHDFFEAPVDDLRRIAGLVGAIRGVNVT